jgi:hypothetical protein
MVATRTLDICINDVIRLCLGARDRVRDAGTISGAGANVS